MKLKVKFQTQNLLLSQMADHILSGERPPQADGNENDDHFNAGHMEHFMVRQNQQNLDADELRKRHAESMVKKANAICTKSYNDPLVKNLSFKQYCEMIT